MTESAGVCEADAPSILGWPTLVTPVIDGLRECKVWVFGEETVRNSCKASIALPDVFDILIPEESALRSGAKAVSEIRFPTSIAQIDFGKAKSSALSVHFVTADGSVGGEAAIGA